MKCESFISWLENRDIHDVSEADRARIHAASCKRCSKLMLQDEALDRCIREAMRKEKIPDGLMQRVDMSLDRSRTRKGMTGLIGAVVALCFVIGVAMVLNQRPDFRTMDQLAASVLAGHLDHGALDIYDPVEDSLVWLTGNVQRKVSPPDRVPEGFTVKGARFCTIEECRVIHMVYGKDDELISVFVVDENDAGFHMELGKTYTLGIEENRITFWKKNGNVYAVVS